MNNTSETKKKAPKLNNAAKINKLKGAGYRVKIVHWRPVVVKHGYGELPKQVTISKHGENKFANVRDELLNEYKAIEATEVKLAPKGGETVAALIDGSGVGKVAAVVECEPTKYYNRKIQTARALGKLMKKMAAAGIVI